ncbi:MAG: hypothetical protein AAFQ82_21290, partial [Myxococcota bacterium]
YWSLSLSGQEPKTIGMTESQAVIREAWTWLQDFWLPRRHVEEAVVGGDVKNPTRPTINEQKTHEMMN